MKRLITTLLLTFGFVFAQVGSVTAAPKQLWKLDMFDPAASTTSRIINIEYKVFSTISGDTFSVELFENDAPKETQSVTHAYGNSGKFSVNMPTTGTYAYKIKATNIGDLNPTTQTREETKTVQVVDGPAPSVTTVFVNNAAGGGQGGGGAQVAAPVAAGQVQGATTNAGENAADQANDTKPGDVLGASAKTTDNNRNRTRNYTIAGLAVLLAAGTGYWYFVFRKRNEA